MVCDDGAWFRSGRRRIRGIYLCRAADGVAQMTTDGGASAGLVSGTLSDGVLAAAIVLAMCVGLLLPNLVLTDLGERIARRKRVTRRT